MEPKTLKEVLPDAHVFIGPAIAEHRQQLASYAAHIIATAAEIETLYGAILTTMLGANAAPAAAMYRALNSLNAQADVVAAAAEAALQPNELDVFEIIIELCSAAAKHRNRLAHWAWGYTDRPRSPILLVNPEALLEYELRTTLLVHPNNGRALSRNFDRDDILVYDEPTLKAASEQISRASLLLSYFRIALGLRPQNPQASNSRLETLCAAPEIASALTELTEKRRRNPSKRARQPRRGRRPKQPPSPPTQ